MTLDNKTLTVWDNAQDCDCDDLDCDTNHKLCGICHGTVVFTAHESNQPNSKFAWNIDHKVRLSEGGSNEISNLQVTHLPCNRTKN